MSLCPGMGLILWIAAGHVNEGKRIEEREKRE
jgi:hypothetical protein